MSAQHTPGPWQAVEQLVGAGIAAKRPWTVQKPGQWYATNGRVHRYASRKRAEEVASTLNLGEAVRTGRAAIAKATGRAA